MTISATPFSGCDCCGYGFEMFEAADDPYWYLSTTAGDLYRLDKEDLTTVDISVFADASRIIQMDRGQRFYYYNTTSLRKYEFDGTQVWSAAVPGVGASSLFRFDVDSSLNVYFAGGVTLSGFTGSLRVLKLDSSGNTVWTFTKTPPELGPANTWTQLTPYGLSVDLQGYIHVTGQRSVLHFDNPGFSDRFRGRFEVHIDPDGNEAWSDLSTSVGGSPATIENYGLQCVCDETGNVICRYGFLGNNNGDGVVLKSYAPDGTLLFSHLRPSAGTGTDTEFPDTNMIRYFSGDLYCCGPFNQTYDTAQTFFQKYNGADYTNLVWTDAPTTGAGKQIPWFALDRLGNVYGVYFDVFPNRNVIRKLNGNTGALINSSQILNKVPFFPMVHPGNPIQFFR